MEMNHVLVVEVDKEIRQGIEIYLKSQGYEVYQAEDGVEGLEVIEKRRDPSRNCRHYDAAHGWNYNDGKIKRKIRLPGYLLIRKIRRSRQDHGTKYGSG